MVEKKYKRGHPREDGKIYWGLNRGREYWVTKESFSKKIESAKKRFQKKQNDLIEKNKTLKRGEIRFDGMIFWVYQAECKNGEYWVTKEEYARLNDNKNARARIRNKTEESKKRKREYEKNRKANDELFRISKAMRTLISMSFKNKGIIKNNKTAKILGCEFNEFLNHIQSQFQPNMSWDNRSEWHIDHIVPLASAKSEEEILRLNHYTNLRPLWAIENLKKGSKLLCQYQ